MNIKIPSAELIRPITKNTGRKSGIKARNLPRTEWEVAYRAQMTLNLGMSRRKRGHETFDRPPPAHNIADRLRG